MLVICNLVLFIIFLMFAFSPGNTKSCCEVEMVRKALEQKHDFQNFLSLTLIAH